MEKMVDLDDHKTAKVTDDTEVAGTDKKSADLKDEWKRKQALVESKKRAEVAQKTKSKAKAKTESETTEALPPTKDKTTAVKTSVEGKKSDVLPRSDGVILPPQVVDSATASSKKSKVLAVPPPPSMTQNVPVAPFHFPAPVSPLVGSELGGAISSPFKVFSGTPEAAVAAVEIVPRVESPKHQAVAAAIANMDAEEKAAAVASIFRDHSADKVVASTQQLPPITPVQQLPASILPANWPPAPEQASSVQQIAPITPVQQIPAPMVPANWPPAASSVQQLSPLVPVQQLPAAILPVNWPPVPGQGSSVQQISPITPVQQIPAPIVPENWPPAPGQPSTLDQSIPIAPVQQIPAPLLPPVIEPPVPEQASVVVPSTPPLPDGWEFVTPASGRGRSYYWNKQTQELTYSFPELKPVEETIPEQPNELYQDNLNSEVQDYLIPDEEIVFTGSTVQIEQQTPEGAFVFSENTDSLAAQPSQIEPPTEEVAPEPELPKGWQFVKSGSKTFYWNRTTKEISYTFPETEPELEPVAEPEPIIANEVVAEPALITDDEPEQITEIESEPNNENQDLEPGYPEGIEPGWVAVPDYASGYLYYWNQLTNEVRWTPPGSPDLDSLPADDSISDQTEQIIQQSTDPIPLAMQWNGIVSALDLQDGWQLYEDPDSNSVFYWNDETTEAWKAMFDPVSGTYVYWNPATSETTFEIPASLIKPKDTEDAFQQQIAEKIAALDPALQGKTLEEIIEEAAQRFQDDLIAQKSEGFSDTEIVEEVVEVETLVDELEQIIDGKKDLVNSLAEEKELLDIETLKQLEDEALEKLFLERSVAMKDSVSQEPEVDLLPFQDAQEGILEPWSPPSSVIFPAEDLAPPQQESIAVDNTMLPLEPQQEPLTVENSMLPLTPQLEPIAVDNAVFPFSPQEVSFTDDNIPLPPPPPRPITVDNPILPSLPQQEPIAVESQIFSPLPQESHTEENEILPSPLPQQGKSIPLDNSMFPFSPQQESIAVENEILPSPPPQASIEVDSPMFPFPPIDDQMLPAPPPRPQASIEVDNPMFPFPPVDDEMLPSPPPPSSIEVDNPMFPFSPQKETISVDNQLFPSPPQQESIEVEKQMFPAPPQQESIEVDNQMFPSPPQKESIAVDNQMFPSPNQDTIEVDNQMFPFPPQQDSIDANKPAFPSIPQKESIAVDNQMFPSPNQDTVEVDNQMFPFPPQQDSIDANIPTFPSIPQQMFPSPPPQESITVDNQMFPSPPQQESLAVDNPMFPTPPQQESIAFDNHMFPAPPQQDSITSSQTSADEPENIQNQPDIENVERMVLGEISQSVSNPSNGDELQTFQEGNNQPLEEVSPANHNIANFLDSFFGEAVAEQKNQELLVGSGTTESQQPADLENTALDNDSDTYNAADSESFSSSVVGVAVPPPSPTESQHQTEVVSTILDSNGAETQDTGDFDSFFSKTIGDVTSPPPMPEQSQLTEVESTPLDSDATGMQDTNEFDKKKSITVPDVPVPPPSPSTTLNSNPVDIQDTDDFDSFFSKTIADVAATSESPTESQPPEIESPQHPIVEDLDQDLFNSFRQAIAAHELLEFHQSEMAPLFNDLWNDAVSVVPTDSNTPEESAGQTEDTEQGWTSEAVETAPAPPGPPPKTLANKAPETAATAVPPLPPSKSASKLEPDPSSLLDLATKAIKEMALKESAVAAEKVFNELWGNSAPGQETELSITQGSRTKDEESESAPAPPGPPPKHTSSEAPEVETAHAPPKPPPKVTESSEPVEKTAAAPPRPPPKATESSEPAEKTSAAPPRPPPKPASEEAEAETVHTPPKPPPKPTESSEPAEKASAAPPKPPPKSASAANKVDVQVSHDPSTLLSLATNEVREVAMRENAIAEEKLRQQQEADMWMTNLFAKSNSGQTKEQTLMSLSEKDDKVKDFQDWLSSKLGAAKHQTELMSLSKSDKNSEISSNSNLRQGVALDDRTHHRTIKNSTIFNVSALLVGVLLVVGFGGAFVAAILSRHQRKVPNTANETSQRNYKHSHCIETDVFLSPHLSETVVYGTV